MNKSFQIKSQFAPAGDQPQAIEQLVDGIQSGLAFQTLLGVTGSGKTFTLANTIAQLNRPTVILAPNKTLAAQLYGEMKEILFVVLFVCVVMCFLFFLQISRK